MRQEVPLMKWRGFSYAASHHSQSRSAYTLWCIFTAMTEPTMHDPQAKRAMDARLARIEGQVRAVRRMIAGDEPCEDIAQQLAAARSALDRAFFEMVSCMIRHEPPAGADARLQRAGRVAELLARFG
jgi:CsoR family transcriptional regulator, copper-sensing transcriptional repressor